MINIAICDDESHSREIVKKKIKEYMMKKGIVFHIDMFSSGKEFTALGIEMLQYHIVCLDINMDEMNGITVAKRIREISNEVFIVFVSAYVNYILEGYKVDAIRYILKNNTNFQSSINECMEAIIEKLNYKVVMETFRFNEGTKEISLGRILYIESRLHKLEFHVMEENLKIYTMYETLNEAENKIKNNNFIRIHHSFLVNIKYIKSIKRYRVLLSNEMELAIAKVRYKYVKDAFIVYQGEI